LQQGNRRLSGANALYYLVQPLGCKTTSQEVLATEVLGTGEPWSQLLLTPNRCMQSLDSAAQLAHHMAVLPGMSHADIKRGIQEGSEPVLETLLQACRTQLAANPAALSTLESGTGQPILHLLMSAARDEAVIKRTALRTRQLVRKRLLLASQCRCASASVRFFLLFDVGPHTSSCNAIRIIECREPILQKGPWRRF
jgi:hypothetical protein